ncbi:MFS transporter [Xaviernesmea oryzae]|uniref:MFS transporter n=1 Tax=Xaviernesmea oryzae TaxID=464029 RepID=A0A1Q9AQR1_9HYPH|nr:MFS transporter [Xaviernesmea oryzae]OLP57750.1 MFS transporter [Xaviernesmea oryzae]SEM06551.1 Major Facilitator Superfamily protein [Xaviernesmea oryzae]
MRSSPITRAHQAHPPLALLSVCLAAAAMPLTFTGTAVALPSIGQALSAGPVAMAWVTNAFMLTFGSALMASGALADSLGRRRVFLFGAGSFALVSLALTAAPNIVLFDLLRGCQGLAAAAAYAGGAAALAQEFDGAARMRAFSVLGTSFGVGLSLGPVASGLMIEHLGWRSIFLAVVAFTTLAFLIGLVALKESRDPAARGLDWAGALGFTTTLGLFTYGMLLVPARGWSDGLVLGLLAAAALCLILFIRIEQTVARPMLDLSLFRYRRFVGVQLLAAAPAYGFVVLLILLPLRFLGIEGMSATAGGGLMIALSAPLLVLPMVAGWLTRWLRPAALCGTGLLMTAGGLVWLSAVPVGAPALALALPMLLIGTGMSMPWGLMDGLAVSVVPRERAGMATGIFSTVRVAGEGVALAIVGAILSLLIAGRIEASGLAGEAQLAGQSLAIGDLSSALAAMPGIDSAQLQLLYGQAFSWLLLLLSGITALIALVVFVSLGREETTLQRKTCEAGSTS